MAGEVPYDDVCGELLRRMTITYRSEHTDRLWAEGAKKGDETRYTDMFAEEFEAGAVLQAQKTLVVCSKAGSIASVRNSGSLLRPVTTSSSSTPGSRSC